VFYPGGLLLFVFVLWACSFVLRWGLCLGWCFIVVFPT